MDDADKKLISALAEKYGLAAGAGGKLAAYLDPLARRWVATAPRFDPTPELILRFDRLMRSKPLYSARPDKSIYALEYYNTTWKDFADAGLLFREDLLSVDEKLVIAIRSACSSQRPKIDPESILPPWRPKDPADELDRRRKQAQKRQQRYLNRQP